MASTQPQVQDEEPIDERNLQLVDGRYTGGTPRVWSLRSLVQADAAWPLNIGEATLFWSERWVQLLKNMRIEILGGRALDRYVRWYLLGEFFHIAGARSSVLRAIQTRDPSMPLNPIYMEASQGSPWGDYVLDILKDQRRADALFVQRYGAVNGVMCEHCERRFTRSDGMEDKRGLWPFSECVSHGEVNRGACGNCIFSLSGSGCTFYGNPEELAHLRVPSDRTTAVNPQSSPPLEGGILQPHNMVYMTQNKVMAFMTVAGAPEFVRATTEAGEV